MAQLMQWEIFFEGELKIILLRNYNIYKKSSFFFIKYNFLPVKLRNMLINVENINNIEQVINILKLPILGNLLHTLKISTLS